MVCQENIDSSLSQPSRSSPCVCPEQGRFAGAVELCRWSLRAVGGLEGLMDSGRVASFVVGFRPEALFSLANSVLAKECEKTSWFGRLGNNAKQNKKSWRQDDNRYCDIINRFHVTALSNPR